VTSERLAGLERGQPVCVVVVPDRGLAVAWRDGGMCVPIAEQDSVALAVAEYAPRWTWWSGQDVAPWLAASSLRIRACWDLGAVGRLLHGLRREDPAAVWAAEAGLPEPAGSAGSGGSLGLFDLDEVDTGPVRDDGQLSAEWVHGRATEDLASALRWAEVGLTLQLRQSQRIVGLPDPRRQPRAPSLALLTAYAESAGALLATELEQNGLPVDRDVFGALLQAAIGDRPVDEADERAKHRAREAAVLSEFPGTPDADLRSPAQVRELLLRVGLDLPDTRSWRLEPHAAIVPAVAALLAWRKADRLATTYGWRWLDANVGEDGRLRGGWAVADGGAGRMTAMAGLHNLPAELRPAVRAEAGQVLVRADLGQVEPRVLAAISGDEALINATHDADMYSPVAARLRCDRPTAKVAVLAAMYGQTSGSAGDTMRVMEQAYPTAVAFLREAETHGRDHVDLRTYGGRLIRLSGAALDSSGQPVSEVTAAAHGRFARNASVQGPAAELFKAWAATVRDGLVELDGLIVLCLHDELLVQVPVGQLEATTRLLHESLAATARWWAAGTAVRFLAEVASGESWSAAH
jgi:DNA polymerase I